MSGPTMFADRAPLQLGTRSPMDRRATRHAVTCDYLIGRGFRACSCTGARKTR